MYVHEPKFQDEYVSFSSKIVCYCCLLLATVVRLEAFHDSSCEALLFKADKKKTSVHNGTLATHHLASDIAISLPGKACVSSIAISLPYHCQAKPVYPVTLPGGAWPWGSVEEEQPKPTESEDFVTIFPPVSAVSASAQIIEPTSLPPEPVTLEDGRWVWGKVVDHV